MVNQRGNGTSSPAPVRVVVDAMGGDYAPHEIVQGAVRALDRGDVAIALVGDQGLVDRDLKPVVGALFSSDATHQGDRQPAQKLASELAWRGCLHT